MSYTMYDDINLDLIPANAQAVAGYVNGRWPTYKEVVKRWPKAKHLSIAVTSFADADCLDVEPGDATNAVAPAWVKRQMARGVAKPVLYTSLSNAQSLVNTLAQVGITRSRIRLWTAHYSHREHLCGPACGFGLKSTADATQWTDKALGRSLDQSLCSDSFFGEVPLPAPQPSPKPPVPPVDSAYIYMRDKDGQKHWEPLTRMGEAKRFAQWQAGKYQELRFKRK